MQIDDFGAFDCAFQPFDDGFSSCGGYSYDFEDAVPVDPFLESFNPCTTDGLAIGIRQLREQSEQQQAQAFAAKHEDECQAAQRWVQAVVQGDEPEDELDIFVPGVSAEVRKWQLAERLSTALAHELGYELDDRDDDCWYRPSDVEWRHFPTPAMHAYNAAYLKFCAVVGKKPAVDSAMTADEWKAALELEAMQKAAAELDAQVMAPRRLRIVRESEAPY